MGRNKGATRVGSVRVSGSKLNSSNPVVVMILKVEKVE